MNILIRDRKGDVVVDRFSDVAKANGQTVNALALAVFRAYLRGRVTLQPEDFDTRLTKASASPSKRR